MVQSGVRDECARQRRAEASFTRLIAVDSRAESCKADGDLGGGGTKDEA